MSVDVPRLIHGYLDDALTDAEMAELNAWLRASVANAREFAQMVRLHDSIQQRLRVPAHHLPTITPMMESADPKMPIRGRWVARWPIVMTVVSLLVVIVWFMRFNEVSAADELTRLIDSASSPRDRTYRIESLDPRPEPIDDRRPPIDGARLYVRSINQYVLIRSFPDGRSFITGSNGEQSWSIPPTGAVRISADPLRFRGPIPGQQHGLPFVDLRSDLVQLRDAYDLSFLEPMGELRGLLASKKSPDYRGPNRVELWYDPRSGVIHQLRFAGMPRARGGPDRLRVELVEQRDLPADFFEAQAHHAPGRRIIEED